MLTPKPRMTRPKLRDVVEDRADALRLDLPPGTDPLAVLDAARAAGRVCWLFIFFRGS